MRGVRGVAGVCGVGGVGGGGGGGPGGSRALRRRRRRDGGKNSVGRRVGWGRRCNGGAGGGHGGNVPPWRLQLVSRRSRLAVHRLSVCVSLCVSSFHRQVPSPHSLASPHTPARPLTAGETGSQPRSGQGRRRRSSLTRQGSQVPRQPGSQAHNTTRGKPRSCDGGRKQGVGVGGNQPRGWRVVCCVWCVSVCVWVIAVMIAPRDWLISAGLLAPRCCWPVLPCAGRPLIQH